MLFYIVFRICCAVATFIFAHFQRNNFKHTRHAHIVTAGLPLYCIGVVYFIHHFIYLLEQEVKKKNAKRTKLCCILRCFVLSKREFVAQNYGWSIDFVYTLHVNIPYLLPFYMHSFHLLSQMHFLFEHTANGAQNLTDFPQTRVVRENIFFIFFLSFFLL